MLTTEMKNSLLIVARDDCHKLQKLDASELQKQRDEKEMKKDRMLDFDCVVLTGCPQKRS